MGTQYRANSIEDALEADKAHLAWSPTVPNRQQGLEVRSGLNPLPYEANVSNGGIATRGDIDSRVERLKIRGWYGAGVAGDEQRKGPIYNYARVFTWWKLACSVESAFRNTVDDVTNENQSSSLAEQANEASDHQDTTNVDIAVGIEATAGHPCTIQPVPAYPEWREIDSDVRTRIWIGSLAAIFLQWGTTGPSILMAYLTPTKGLSCRSGSYLLYGAMGTMVWLCLLVSMLLSHEVMLRYQHVQERPSADFRQYTRTFPHACLCAASVCLRRIGKFLAGVNALWLIVSSLLEFIGVYDNCWCSGDVVGLGDHGWIVLFKNKADLRNKALGPWSGGLSITCLICLVSCACFYIGCLESDDDRRR